jgi:hypothetical protein
MINADAVDINEHKAMRQFIRYHRSLLVVMAAACAGGLACLAVFGETQWWIGFGAGAAAQLFKFAFVDAAVVRRLAEGKTDVVAAQARGMIYSLIVFGIAVLAIYNFGGSVWAMAAGIFLPRVILIADTWLRPDLFRTSCK